MKSIKKILDYQHKIISLLEPQEYTKIDDLAVDCLAGPAGRNLCFMHAIEDLVTCGQLEACGNEVRLSQ